MSDLQDQIKEWWNNHPYTYGLSKQDSYRDVGNISDDKLTIEFFDRYMRKVRKHFDDAQNVDQKLAGRFIEYDHLSGKQVLDIACGFGWGAIEMAKAGAVVSAIDLTPRAIEAARKHFELRRLQGDLQVMDAQNMEFADNTFDFVLAWGCLMHMPDTERAIAEIKRVLKPGGKVFGYMYNKNSISYWWHIWFLRGVLLGQLFPFRGDTNRLVSRFTDGESFGGNRLTKVYTPKAATTMFAKAGFTQIDFRPWGPPEMIRSFPVGKLPLGKLLPYSVRKAIADRFGWGMVFNARKPAAVS
jgi:2-polyprenyl-3-methyl-5-hydroxy-6-metoxy-1,4-benzoquinol methylase